jgi:KipI family sensor histidine kinase inhibitor
MRVLPAGRSARLVEFETDGESSAALRAALLEADHDGIVEDAVPALRSLLVSVARERDLGALDRLIADSWRPGIPNPLVEPRSAVTIPVRYDGIDLASVAAKTGLTVDEVVRLHSEALHTVDFFGFAPGFAYIGGVPEVLRLPRRDSPRTRIAPGSLAIAAGQSVVYPGGTPGGWHIIGHTDVLLWDAGRAQPNLLEVGTVVRFEAT